MGVAPVFGMAWQGSKDTALSIFPDLRVNYKDTLFLSVQDGLGSYFWQHNWGSPKGAAHPAAHLHQVEIDKRTVGGVGVDINHILKPQFGQWA